MNTAECVIEGHKTNISAIPTEHRAHINAMLWCSFVFTILFGPTLATITFVLFDMAKHDKTKKLAKAVKCVSCFLSIVENALLFTALKFSISGNALRELYVILPLIFSEGLVLAIACFKAKKSYDFFPENTPKEFMVRLGIFLWANLTMYYFCWLVIGIMVNPLWGFTVLFFISVVIAVTVFLVFLLLDGFDSLIFILCLFGGVSTVLLVTLVILAGQSFFMRETANEVMKAALLGIITALITWIISKILGEKSEKSKKNNGEENKSNVPERQEMIQRPSPPP